MESKSICCFVTGFGQMMKVYICKGTPLFLYLVLIIKPPGYAWPSVMMIGITMKLFIILTMFDYWLAPTLRGVVKAALCSEVKLGSSVKLFSLSKTATSKPADCSRAAKRFSALLEITEKLERDDFFSCCHILLFKNEKFTRMDGVSTDQVSAAWPGYLVRQAKETDWHPLSEWRMNYWS